jgi:hypothetical protein
MDRVLVENLLVPHLVNKLHPCTWKHESHERGQKSPPIAPVVIHILPVHKLSLSHYFKFLLNIIPSFMPRSSKLSLAFKFLCMPHFSTPPMYHMALYISPSSILLTKDYLVEQYILWIYCIIYIYKLYILYILWCTGNQAYK